MSPRALTQLCRATWIVAVVGAATISSAVEYHKYFEKTYDGPAAKADGASVVKADRALGNTGGIIVAGYENGTDNKGEDMSIAKYDRLGALVWRISYDRGLTKNERLNDIAIDNGGNIIGVGSVQNADGTTDMFTGCWNYQGQLQWAQTYNGGANKDDVLNSVVVNDAGHCFVTGSAREDSPLEYKDNDIITMAYNVADGQRRWLKWYDYDTIDQDDQPVKMIHQDGILHIAGTSVASGEREDVVVLRYAAGGGTFQKVARYSGAGHAEERVWDLDVDAQGNAYVAGSTAVEDFGTTDFMLLKFDYEALVWDRVYNGVGNGSDAAIAVEESYGSLYVAGTMYTGEETLSDVAFMRFNLDGTRTYEKSYSTPGAKYDDVVDMVDPFNGELMILVQPLDPGADFDIGLVSFKHNGDFAGQSIYNSGGKDFATDLLAFGNGTTVVAGSQWTTSAPESANQLVLAQWKGILDVDIPGASDDIHGGTTKEARVILAAEALQPVTVNLASSSADVTVPESVVVPVNALEAAFNITTNAVLGTEPVTITATLTDGVNDPRTLTFNLLRTEMKTFKLVEADVYGGGTEWAQVDLTGKSPEGLTATITDNSTAITTPASMTFLKDNLSQRFSYTTTPVTASVSRAISVKVHDKTISQIVKIHPGVKAFSINPNSVTGGSATSGLITLNGPAKPGGAAVFIQSNSGSISVPESILIPAGQTTATFPINTSQVGADATRIVRIDLGSLRKQATLTLTAGPRLAGLALNPTTVVGGQSSTGTVTLTGAAPAGGREVALTDNSSVLSVPASVNVPQTATAATFQVTTTQVTAVATRQVIASLGGVTRTANLTIQPGTALTALTLSSSTVKGGTSLTGTVTLLNNAPTGGTVVTLSDNSGNITTPANTTVAAGTKTKGFAITTTAVTATATRQVIASYNGVTKTANLTLTS